MATDDLTEFAPMKNSLWALELEGIDPALIESIQLPTFQHGVQRYMVVGFHNVQGDDLTPRIYKWFQLASDKKGELRFIDSLGQVTQRWTFQADARRVWFSRLAYGDRGNFQTFVELELRALDIQACSKREQ